MYTGGALDLDVHLGPLRVAVLQAAHKWKDIGRALPGVTEGNIQSIRFNEDSECLNAVLSKWIKTGCAKTNDLLEALEEPTVGRTDIANKIRNLKGEERAKVGLDIYSGRLSQSLIISRNEKCYNFARVLLEYCPQSTGLKPINSNVVILGMYKKNKSLCCHGNHKCA